MCFQRLTSILSISLTLSTQFAAAGTLSYSPPVNDRPSRFSGAIPLTKIGSLSLPRGEAKFDGDEIKILAVPQWLFDRNTVLQGALIRAEFAPLQETATLAGLIYFFDGLWIDSLSKNPDTESIETSDGATLSGRVTGRTSSALTFKLKDGSNQEIEFAKIRSITSPRAYTFGIPATSVKVDPADGATAFHASLIRLLPVKPGHQLFASAGGKVPRSNLAGTEPGISKQALIAMFAMDVAIDIAPAVVVPLVLNRSTQEAAANRIRTYANQGLVNGTAPPPTPPIYAPLNSIDR